MTLLVSYNYAFLHFYVCFSSVANYIAKMSKTNKSNSAMSLSIDNGRFKKFSVLSRCNSFSSCSNDSAVYCGHHTVQTRFRNAKRAVVNNSSGPRKRSRNSSGSSISSNMSCVSDKDLKSAKVLSPALNKTEIKSCVSNNSGISRLKYSKINSSSGELKEETVVNKEVSCSENSLVILPNKHNLRGKITKKGCTCCPSTCTTVFLRHYKKFVKTTDEKTVISSTKVKTFVQKGSAHSSTKVNKESNVLSNKSKSRKRRSEIEKLYESLHEIEWAKNFSPDNILRQINVRQAASCSGFGKTQNSTRNSRPKICRKQKNLNHFCKDISSPFNKSECTKSNFSITECSNSNCDGSVKSVLNRETGTQRKCDNEQKVADLQTTEITTSDIYHCKKNYKSCSSQSSVNITCSLSHINLKEININSVESLHRAQTLLTENSGDYSDDAQLSYTSDESSSAVSASIVNIQSKHLLDLNYKEKKPRGLSETDVSEFSPTPTFFDIAEEGIRTIDACFREVGAEVVVSTCYDEESSLPLLTSVRENKISSKVLSNDDPPILEPCVDVAFKQSLNCSSKNNSEKKCENRRLRQNTCTNTKLKNICYDKKNLSLHCKQRDPQIKVASQTPKMKHTLLHNIDLLTINIGKKILKKYIKQSRSRLKSLPNNICKFTVKNSELNQSNSHCIKSCTVLNETTKNPLNCQNSVLLSSSSKPLELSFKTPGKETKMIFKATLEEKYPENKEKGVVESVKNGSCIFQSGKIVKCPSDVAKASVISQSKSSGPKSAFITSFISTKVENENGIKKEHISRPPPSFGLSCHYKSIRVNRSYNYTHIILLVTRGKSIFLTLEALTELRDALNRTNNDSSCQVLIVNGVGDSFCLGLDLKPLIGPRKKIASTEIAVAVKELIEALSEFKKPLAAVVNGPALGLGMTLLNHADFTIASDKATFCMPYSYLGYMPEGGATLTLPQIVGSTVAMDLLLRGKTLTAREACNVGLISEVLEAKRLPHELVSRVRMLAENPLSALETTKALLKMQLHVNLQLVLENEVKLLPRMWLTRTCQNSLRRALESGILSK